MTDDNWSNERIERRLKRRGVTARLQFSTREGLARVDVYRKDSFPPVLEDILEERGWQKAGSHHDLPAGCVGSIYRHADASGTNYRETRELLLRDVEEVTSEPAAPIDRLRLAPSDVPHDVATFSRWTHFACVEWSVPHLSVAASDGLRRNDEAAFLKFLEWYESWWLLPEEEKFKRMHPVQRAGPRRLEYLGKAMKAVLGCETYQ